MGWGDRLLDPTERLALVLGLLYPPGCFFLCLLWFLLFSIERDEDGMGEKKFV